MEGDENLKKLIAAALLFLLIAGLLLPLAATNAHYYFSKEYRSFTLHLGSCWEMLLTSNLVKSFYAVFAVLTALWIYWIFWGYRIFNTDTPMQKITPDIYTPCPAGNGQFGTAKWMDKRQLGKFFSSWKVARRKDWYGQLISAGKETYKEVKHQNAK